MPKTRQPRAGSMQFWPRVRSKYTYPRIRNWPKSSDAKLLGFAGYKVGMTHILINDNRAHSLTKGTEIFCPTTIIECPPIKAFSIRFYKNTQNGSRLISELTSESTSKDLERKITKNKKIGKEADDFDNVTILCHTQPRLTGIGKKKPEIIEIGIGGNKEQQLLYAREKLGKEISINEVFKEGQQLDIHAITTGKGFQGPIKRFGVQLRHHKSEKSRRNPGSLGPWKAQGQVMWRTAHAGKMGYHLRTEYNKQIMKIGNKSDDINPNGGFINYGKIKSQYMLVKGSVSGTQKRLIRFTDAVRAKVAFEPPQIIYTSLESKQGN